ncbi:hypothetical protein LCGC14_2423750, partial [marine sediment metagenome]
MSDMNAAITGGTGFIGSHLAERLVSSGYRVRCLVRKGSDLHNISGLDVEVFYGDMRDVDSLKPVVEGADYVFHLAALTLGNTREDFFRVDVTGTENLLNACIIHAPHLKKFVHVSSISAVGPRSGIETLSKDPPCRPIDYYGESKSAGEKIALEYRNRIPLTIIRPSTVYGPRDNNPFTVLRYMKMVRRGFYLLRGSEKQYISAIFVSDVVDGIVIAAENDISRGQKYFLCNEKITSYDEICKLTSEALQRKAIKIRVPDFVLNARAFLKRKRPEGGPLSHTRHWICSSAKAKRDLGIEAR